MKTVTKITNAQYGMNVKTPYKVGLTLSFENGDSLSIYGKVYYASSNSDKIAFYEVSREIVTLLRAASVFNISELIGKEVEIQYKENTREIIDIIFI